MFAIGLLPQFTVRYWREAGAAASNSAIAMLPLAINMAVGACSHLVLSIFGEGGRTQAYNGSCRCKKQCAKEKKLFHIFYPKYVSGATSNGYNFFVVIPLMERRAGK